MSRTGSAIGLLQETIDRLLPREERVARPVRAQPLEAVALEPQPRRVREVAVDHLAPRRHRKAELGVLVPADAADLQPAVGPRVEHGAAEQELEWHLAVLERAEVARRRHLEV